MSTPAIILVEVLHTRHLQSSLHLSIEDSLEQMQSEIAFGIDRGPSWAGEQV